MPLTTTKRLLEDALARGGGVGAFNVITLEHAEAVVAAAEKVKAPVILQISENAVAFHQGHVRPLLEACAALACVSGAPVSIHMDHVESEALLRDIEGTAVTSLMFDASKLDYDENVRLTRTTAAWAHERDLHVEAELGEVGGKNGPHAPGVRTDPSQAADFVAATGVDSLAVAVGSSHAMSTRDAALDYVLIAQMKAAVNVPLVLHGSSGVSDEGLRAAVRAGMTKINVGTRLNVAYTASVRSDIGDDSVIDPRTYLAKARDAMSQVVEQYLCAIAGAVKAE